MKRINFNKRKVKTKQTVVILISFIVGIFIAIYFKSMNSDNVYITLEQKRELEDEIDNINLNISKLDEIKKEHETKLKTYEDVLEDDNMSVEDLMRDELNYLKGISGYSEVIGSGITVIIKDSERELSSGESPNDLLVHDIDILRILNDLKKAGAKAISINGERVLPTSEVKCSGATITVNQTTYGQPFEIKAIGNIDLLVASINSEESYSSLLRDIYGIYINIEKNEEMVVNFYEKNK